MVERIGLRRGVLETRKRSISQWNVPAPVRADVLRFLTDLELGKVNRGKRVGEGAQLKYFEMLRVALQFLAKEIEALELGDIEKFEIALATDNLRSHRKKAPYSYATKTAMRKSLRTFLRWRLGQARGSELAGWLDTRDKPKTPAFLTEDEVERMFRLCRTTSERFALAVLFDSGARAEEFLNIRYEDIKLPEGKENFVKLTLKEEYSKTLGRTISLYWRHSLGAVQDFLHERIKAGIKPHDPVFNFRYDTLRFFVSRLGKRVLDKQVYPHLLRHSSATFYATKLNRQELCYRYGWRFSSNMPDVYIARSGMEVAKIDEKFSSSELNDLRHELEKKNESDKIKDQRIQFLEERLLTIERHFDALADKMRKGATVECVIDAIRSRKAPGNQVAE